MTCLRSASRNQASAPSRHSRRSALLTPPRHSGYTLIELLVVLSILGILMSIAGLSVRDLNDDAQAASSIVSASLLQARTQAISTTSAVRVTLSAPRTLLFETNDGCAATTPWRPVSSVVAGLPEGVTLRGTGSRAGIPWQACFAARGELRALPASALTVRDRRGRERALTLYLSGSMATR